MSGSADQFWLSDTGATRGMIKKHKYVSVERERDDQLFHFFYQKLIFWMSCDEKAFRSIYTLKEHDFTTWGIFLN